MIVSAELVVSLLTLLTGVGEDGVVARAERTELIGSEKAIPRVERDADGNVAGLLLQNMRLTAGEFAEIGRLTRLRYLVLYKTNVTDDDLKLLRGLTHLEGLNLTSTDISDSAIDEIIQLKSLKSLCLGSVNITPDAVAKLKTHFHSRGQRVGLGYSQRRKLKDPE